MLPVFPIKGCFLFVFFCLDTKIKKTICNFRSIIFASPRVHTCIVSAKAQTGLKESQLSQLNFVTVFQKAPSLRPKNVVTDAKGGKSLDDSHSLCANMCARPQCPFCIVQGVYTFETLKSILTS